MKTDVELVAEQAAFLMRPQVWQEAVVAASRRDAVHSATGTFDSQVRGIQSAQDAVDWADHVLRCFDSRFID